MNTTTFYVNFRFFHYYYEIALAILSFSLNGSVVYLALTTKNHVMKSYCWVVLLSMLGDFLYTGINFLTMTMAEVKAGQMYILTLGILEQKPYPYNMIAGCLYLSAMYIVILTIGLQFVYRYYTLCKKALTMFEFTRIYVIGLVLCFFEGFIGLWLFRGMSEKDTKLIQEHPMYTHDTPGYLIVDPREPGSLFHLTASQVIVGGVYIVIYYTGKRIGQKLNDTGNKMSQKTQMAHQQLNKMMMIQAVYPALIVGLPIIVGTILTQLKQDVLWGGLYFIPSISIIPMANSITILAVIPSFRQRILKFTRGRGRIYSTTTTGRSISKNGTAETDTTLAQHA